ncbi:MAG: DNA-directed RNA polymerase subunit beta' [Treponema sp.]|uniref:DNA-directed RNA polymerase subunit beta' n=1 Tax=Treponema sp. TaxID=166 RepID=UPI001D49465F|nr:DNA-directed RNA polymerase subunit beta' [Treponema sp.]MCI6441987.1 DNA-directed RNA polymerase subunit beta' [Spirochaetia bacterium]
MRDIQDFSSLKITLASPETIRQWSYGEVKKPETINYRTLRPEREGLFCEKIFGTTKEWECYCGKFKSIRYKGVVCDRCGVEVTHFKVRRERTGHIELAAPVSHIWYYHSVPSRMGLLLDLPVASLRSILYYEKYIVIEPGDTDLKKNQLLTEEEYQAAEERFGGSFTAGMGAEAIKTLLENLNLDEIAAELRAKMIEKGSKSDKRLLKRIEIIENFRNSENKPSWMILDVIPVIPPDLRPMVQLDGGRFATSDLNDLYRRVINRNNRLRKLQGLSAPDIIIRNEKRMLQEAVDSLFDNSKRKQRVLKGAANRPLKSISDMLKGKQGRFRQNLLGKRVDYSGRSVIVVGPELKLWQCGLPEKMALELFKPFIMKKLVANGICGNIKRARSLVESEDEAVFNILDEVVREHPVMLNRAPTLHRLGIQAFEPVLVPGKALKLHPLACKAFNADFDGDQMAIHVPLTQAAQMECWTLMLSARNLLDPANGSTIVAPSQDMVLGIYYMTSIKPNAKGTGKFFSSADEVRLAASSGAIDWQARIKIHKNILDKCVQFDENPESEYILTSAGRMAFNEAMPEEVDFMNDQIVDPKKKITADSGLGDKGIKAMIERVYHNEQTSDKRIRALIEEKFGVTSMDAETLDKVMADAETVAAINKIFNRKTPMEESKLRKLLPSLYGIDRAWLTVQMLDAVKATGYKNATFYGATISMDDIIVPEEKKQMMKEANDEVKKIVEQNQKGVITDDERYNRSIAVWEKTTKDLTAKMMEKMKSDKDGFNTIYMMANSGARGSEKQISQLAAMRGLMQKPNGAIIELPIQANFKEGLSVIEYFISSNGARKGLSDTALKTADAGYMTRRLVDVAQDVVVNEDDCGTINGIYYSAIREGDEVKVPLAKRIAGHFPIERVIDPFTGELICEVNQYIDEHLAEKIDAAGVEKVKLRTVLTCESKHGICVKCYGKDLARNKIVEIGEAVGTIAAQSIGQPGTQLTLRTFHTGGAAEASQKDNHIVMKYDVLLSSVKGTHVEKKNGDWLFTRKGKMLTSKIFNTYTISAGDEVLVSDEGKIRKNNAILKHKGQDVLASDDGRIIIRDKTIYLLSRSEQEVEISNGSLVYSKFVKGECVAKANEEIGEFDLYSEPIIAEQSGYIHFDDIIEGVTLNVREDKLTGMRECRISDLHIDVRQPRIRITDEDGNEFASYNMPVGALLSNDIKDKGKVEAGTTLAKMPKEAAKANDITLGLPRVSELFEARQSKKNPPAIISKITGTVSFGKIVKGKITVIVTDEYGVKYEHLVPVVKRLLVREGDEVKAGDKICDGSIDAHDVLTVLGEDKLQEFLMEEIQNVYRGQGVDINDKHIGTIIRQMLRKVEVINVGDTKFRYGQQIDKYSFREENERILAEGGTPAVARPMFQGITKAALAADSFISACSFQETTRVLTNAAIAGAVDNLHGLKENIIIGHRIPAGSGIRQYSNIKLSDDSTTDLDAKMKEILEQRMQEQREAEIAQANQPMIDSASDEE